MIARECGKKPQRRGPCATGRRLECQGGLPMARNGNIPAIDADGHILERREDIARYLDGDYRGRQGPLAPGGQPWDTEMGGKLGMKGYRRDLSPAGQVAFWHRILDTYDMETAVLFPTGSGNMAKLQEPGFAAAATKAANIHFARDYLTDRLKPVGVLPMRDPKESVIRSSIRSTRKPRSSGLPSASTAHATGRTNGARGSSAPSARCTAMPFPPA
jgi:hypothetical protein